VKLCNHYRASGETSRQEAVHRMILGSTVGFRNETEFKELEPNINCN
jgi:chemotaxis methyl-accepting protein methylase